MRINIINHVLQFFVVFLVGSILGFSLVAHAASEPKRILGVANNTGTPAIQGPMYDPRLSRSDVLSGTKNVFKCITTNGYTSIAYQMIDSNLNYSNFKVFISGETTGPWFLSTMGDEVINQNPAVTTKKYCFGLVSSAYSSHWLNTKRHR
jgi:hypothetical protein